MKLEPQYYRTYITAGNVELIIYNNQSQAQRLYNIEKKDSGVFWVYSLNQSTMTYLGFIDRRGVFKFHAGQEKMPLAQGFEYVWRNLDHLPEHVELHHPGKCQHCGRKLTDHYSMAVGHGPDCRKKLGIPEQLKLAL